MLKVNNKKVITDLAKTTYKANKKRNCLTIAAIFLTTFLICTVISIGLCYWETLSIRKQIMQGMDYDIELTEPREDQVLSIRQMGSVKYAGLCVKCAVISNYKGKDLGNVRLFWLDNTCWSKQTIPALDSYVGNYPLKENEIMLSKDALNSMGIKNPKIGMKLPFLYRALTLDSSNENRTKTFLLSGWFIDYTGSNKGYVSEKFYKTTGVHQTDFTWGKLKISLKNPLYSKNDIIEMQKQIEISGKQIINADYDTISNFCRTMIGLFILLMLVFFSGYLFIYNTLYLSINKDIQYYGQLKTIGATSVQIRKMIYMQTFWNAFFGIPLGLMASAIIDTLVIPLALHAVNPTIRAKDVGEVPFWAFLAAMIFSLITSLVSSLKPAKIAMNYSPMEALKYVGSAVKVKRRKKIAKGGNIRSMVKQNLLRDKKQFIIIMASLSLAVTLFLIINVVIYGNNAANILNHAYDSDLKIINQTMLSEKEEQAITDDIIKKIEAVDGVTDIRILKSAMAVVPYQEKVYGDYYKELYQSRYSPGNYQEDMAIYKKQPDYYAFSCRVIGISDSEFASINATLDNPLNKQAFEKGKVAIASKNFTKGENGITGKSVKFSIPSSLNPKKEENIKIAAVINTSPAYFSDGYTPNLIVSENYFDKLLDNPFIELIKIDYDKPFSENTENAILNIIKKNPHLSTDSKLARYAEMKHSEKQITILGSSIGLIIMFLAISNYINMMSASIQNRSKEFAILESIGMTRKQIKKMLTMESLSYVFLSILISLLISLPASYFAFTSFNIYRIPFAIPHRNNLILFSIIIVVCILTTLLVFSKSKNETIIELLQKDEI